MKKLGVVLCLTLAVALLGGTALAQGDQSVYFTTYYANARVGGAPDGTVRIINDGDTGNTLWASFYVFDDSQELQECCSCPITADGVLSESVNNNLLSNPLTGKVNHRGVIKVIASSTGNGGASNTTAKGLRGWSTHIQSAANAYPYGPAPYSQTETMLADSNLISSEQTLLQNLCSFAIVLGSGSGVCSCTNEDFDF